MELNRKLSSTRSEEINVAAPIGEQQWDEVTLGNIKKVQRKRPNQQKVEGMVNRACKNLAGSQKGKGDLDIVYFTDPLCCWSWAMKAQLTRLNENWQGTIK